MIPTIQHIDEAANILSGVAEKTPLQYSKRLSKKYKAHVFLKREDLQEVRSFKIRGAYNKMASLTERERKNGVVCASAGNHAQGVAWSCNALKVHGTIFMPTVTPNQKIQKVKQFGDGYVDIKLVGETFDDAGVASFEYAKKIGASYIHPFDDPLTIAGQGTVGKEIIDQMDKEVDFVFVCIGGGGLISGISTYFRDVHKDARIIGVEPVGAPSMHDALEKNHVVTLKTIDTFVDGAAVRKAGDLTFEIVKKNVDDVILVPEGKICSTMIELYQNEGIVTEPAGALSVSALDHYVEKIKGRTVVCVISGGNNDILRYPEIMEKSLVYQGRKHYFLINFAQKPGQLKRMLDEALGPNDDIVRFEYMKKTNKEKAPALVGIELADKNDFKPLVSRLEKIGVAFEIISPDDMLYRYIV